MALPTFSPTYGPLLDIMHYVTSQESIPVYFVEYVLIHACLCV